VFTGLLVYNKWVHTTNRFHKIHTIEGSSKKSKREGLILIFVIDKKKCSCNWQKKNVEKTAFEQRSNMGKTMSYWSPKEENLLAEERASAIVPVWVMFSLFKESEEVNMAEAK
jgi:hypothetical protein